jgi:hypothetical protein
MDFPSREELFYNDHKGDIQSMSKWLGVDRHSCFHFNLFFFFLFGYISNDHKGDVQSMTGVDRHSFFWGVFVPLIFLLLSFSFSLCAHCPSFCSLTFFCFAHLSAKGLQLELLCLLSSQVASLLSSSSPFPLSLLCLSSYSSCSSHSSYSSCLAPLAPLLIPTCFDSLMFFSCFSLVFRTSVCPLSCGVSHVAYLMWRISCGVT